MIESDESDSCTLSTVKLTLGSLTPPTASQVKLFGRRPAVHRVMRSIAQKYPGVLKRTETDPHALWEEERARMVSYEGGVLVVGDWLLVIGCWLLVVACW